MSLGLSVTSMLGVGITQQPPRSRCVKPMSDSAGLLKMASVLIVDEARTVVERLARDLDKRCAVVSAVHSAPQAEAQRPAPRAAGRGRRRCPFARQPPDRRARAHWAWFRIWPATTRRGAQYVFSSQHRLLLTMPAHGLLCANAGTRYFGPEKPLHAVIRYTASPPRSDSVADFHVAQSAMGPVGRWPRGTRRWLRSWLGAVEVCSVILCDPRYQHLILEHVPILSTSRRAGLGLYSRAGP